MEREIIEQQMLDLLEGSLAETEADALRQHIAADPELKSIFKGHERLFEIESKAQEVKHPGNSEFVQSVMKDLPELTDKSFIEWLIRAVSETRSRPPTALLAGVATLFVMAISVQLLIDTPEDALSRPASVSRGKDLVRKTVGIQSEGGTVTLFTSSRSIPAGAKLLEYKFKPVYWPSKSIPKGAVRDLAELQGMFAKQQIVPGLPIQRSQLTKQATAASLQIAPGLRAVTVAIDATRGVEGWAQPGSRVDAIVTYNENGKLKSKVIAENLRVLSLGGTSRAINSTESRGTGKSSHVTTTVEALPQDALEIQTAQQIGKVTFLMRSQEDDLAISTGELGRNAIEGVRHAATANDLLAGSTSKRVSKQAQGKMRVGGKEYIISQNGSLLPVEQLGESARKDHGSLYDYYSEKHPAPLKQEGAYYRKPHSTVPEIAPGRLDYSRAPSIDRMPPTINNERYGEWEENQRTVVADEPMSTFSIDVDTGSYTNVRRYLEQGEFPPASAVRIEEFLNYFSYDYPSHSDKPFALNYEIAPAPLEPDRYLLKLGVKAKDILATDKPKNLVFLIDVSGSMAGQRKLGLVKKALKLLVQQMKAGDRTSIVTYAGYSGIALAPTGSDQAERIHQVIDSLHAGGSTNGSQGIHTAYQLARQSFITNGVNRVVLATDGDFNVGTVGTAPLLRMIEEKRSAGITLTTVGVGSGNINEAMMEQLANKGNGNYFYLDSFKEARKVFEKELAGTLEVVAKDVKLQIEFNPVYVESYRLVGYENRTLENKDFSNDAVDAGEIGAGHTVTALYEIVLTDSPLATQYRYQKAEEKESSVSNKQLAAEIGFLKIRYTEPEGSRSELLEFPLKREVILSDWRESSDDFRFAAAVSGFAHILRKSQYAGAYSLVDVEQLTKEALGKDADGYRREFLELVGNARAARER